MTLALPLALGIGVGIGIGIGVSPIRSVALTLALTLVLPLTLGMELAKLKDGKQDICQDCQDWMARVNKGQMKARRNAKRKSQDPRLFL